MLTPRALAIAMIKAAPPETFQMMRCHPFWSGNGWEGSDKSLAASKIPDTSKDGWENSPEIASLTPYVSMYWTEYSQPAGSYLLLKVPQMCKASSSRDVAWLCRVEPTSYEIFRRFANRPPGLSNMTQTPQHPMFQLYPQKNAGPRQPSPEQQEQLKKLPPVLLEQYRLVTVVARVDSEFAKGLNRRHRRTTVRMNDEQVRKLLKHCGVLSHGDGFEKNALLQSHSQSATSSSGNKTKMDQADHHEDKRTTMVSSQDNDRENSLHLGNRDVGGGAGISSSQLQLLAGGGERETRKVTGVEGKTPLGVDDQRMFQLLDDFFEKKKGVKTKALTQTRIGSQKNWVKSLSLGVAKHYHRGCVPTKHMKKLSNDEDKRRVCEEIAQSLNSDQSRIRHLRATKKTAESEASKTTSSRPTSTTARQRQAATSNSGFTVGENVTPFYYSSVNIHQKATTKPHFDKGNFGDSVVHTVGRFRGGGLFVHDPSVKLSDLDPSLPHIHDPVDGRAVRLEVSAELAENKKERNGLRGAKLHEQMEDEAQEEHLDSTSGSSSSSSSKRKKIKKYYIFGREYRAKFLRLNASQILHATMPFEGERYCLVYFLHTSLPDLRTRQGRGPDDFVALLDYLIGLGFPVPRSAESEFWPAVDLAPSMNSNPANKGASGSAGSEQEVIDLTREPSEVIELSSSSEDEDEAE
ncbi:unnamed protein product [Amoebophrya sp. A120]|nr:unnamed protein product [Amoebophrya sp. A120]|eukprot:GSA120T00018176001.1